MNNRLGWHNRGYLPHFDCYGAAQHVIFRTFASLDAASINNARTMSQDQARAWLDEKLDHSKTGRIFDGTRAADMMEETLRYFDGSRFDLLAWCVMPNHVHSLIVPLGENRLGDIVRTWKMQATKRLGCGRVFATDYYDRFIRNSKHMATTLAYIENNPVKAGLCIEPSEWAWSSASKKAQGWMPRTENCPLFLR
jgi:REP element-mobilizing transposase RayT